MRQLGLLPATLAHFELDIGQLTNLRRIGDKAGGSKDVSEAGGLYVNREGRTLLLKQSSQPEQDMAEWINGMTNRSFIPDGVQVVPLRHDGQTYLASLFIEGAVDLYRHAYEAAGKTPPKDRPRVHLGNREATALVDAAFRECGDKGLAPLLAMALLMGNMDVHSGNFMVRRDERGNVERVCAIDLGWGSRNPRFLGKQIGDHFGAQVHPNSHSRRLPMVGPTNHHVDIPPELRRSPAYIDEVLKVAEHEFEPAIRAAFRQAAEHWGPEVFQAFSKSAGLDSPRGSGASRRSVEQAYVQRFSERQASMCRYAADLAVGLAHVERPGAHSKTERLVLDTEPDGTIAVDRYLAHPAMRSLIEQFVAGDSDGPKQRNHALDAHGDALRAALTQRLAACPLKDQR
ncbi:MAG: hypothetical protein JWP52_1873 [Rhizobacter sp.]|nr:hypothetical protein [Rhizobacter sp.]